MSNCSMLRARLMRALRLNLEACVAAGAGTEEENTLAWAKQAAGILDDNQARSLAEAVVWEHYDTRSLEYLVHLAFNAGIINEAAPVNPIS